jgi:phosphatidate cytidylyltransferase
MIGKREISAIIGIPLLLFFTISGGIIFKISVIFITAVALYEYVNAYKNTAHRAILFVIGFGFVLYYWFIIMNSLKYALPIIFLISIISMATPIFNSKYNVVSSAISITGFIYIVCFFSLVILIRDSDHGKALIWLVFIIAWCSDTFAYYIGKNLGKHKLCPLVSPKKTIEGYIGGIFGSIVGVLVWGYLNVNINFCWYQLIALAACGSAIAQIGDLSASLIKRYIGLKDYGNIMPGHGGILDRFDSILFVAPVVYYYIVIFLG